jgi:hypothetical protein
MRNRILLALLIIAALAGVIAVVWFILRPVLPGGLAPQPPGSTQGQSEKPFNPTPSLPTPATSTGSTDTNSPEERERQAQEALKRTSIDMAARLNTYSNADDFEALRTMQANVDAVFALKLQATRATLRRDHPSFGASWGQSTQALSAAINSPAPILTATQASVTVQVQTTVEEAGKANVVTQNRVTLSLRRNGNSWTVTDQAILAGE